MTMEEMARIIGVSRITLSKVMNDKEGVSEKTRERVKEYIKKYNFEPNSQARSLVGKKEPIIGFFTTYSEESSGSTHITSHFATELVNLVVNAAQKRDYKTLVDITGGDDDFPTLRDISAQAWSAGLFSWLCHRKQKAGKIISERDSPRTD